VIWVAVGGRGTLIGPIIGALVVNFGKTYFTGALPEVWLFALGAIFVAVTLFLPKGIVGTVGSLLARRPKAVPRPADSALPAPVALRETQAEQGAE
jgi:urea transport system permease protein